MKRQKPNGFTLLEVMISLAILATMAVLIARSIQQAIKSKSYIQNQVDDLSKIRDALRLMERDLAMTFHYRDLEKELNEAIEKQKADDAAKAKPTDPNALPQTNSEAAKPTEREAPREDPITHFVGLSDQMNFVTKNNGQMLADVKQADFVEVGYSLKDCKRKNADSSRLNKCLWRRQSALVDTDVTKGGTEIALLEDLTEFKLRYVGKVRDEWSSDWRTDGSTDNITYQQFPEAVEISLTVERGEGDKKKKYSMQVVAPIHFPNNKSKEEQESNNEVKKDTPAKPSQ